MQSLYVVILTVNNYLEQGGICQSVGFEVKVCGLPKKTHCFSVIFHHVSFLQLTFLNEVWRCELHTRI